MARIGIDLGGTKIEGILLDTAGRAILRQRIATPRGSYQGTVAAIASLVADLEQAADLTEPASVGIGIPGIISPATGLVKNANSTWLIGQKLDVDLEAALNRPVRIENDANCLALSEASDGAGADYDVVFAAILGTGCGAGIVSHGKLLSGRNAIGGEWGHNPLPWMTGTEYPGPDCYCGRRGCIECFVAGPAIAADHASRNGLAPANALRSEEIFRQAELCDPAALASFTLWIDRVGRSLAAMANLLDPDVIVLGGGLSNVAGLYDQLPAVIASYAFTDQFTTPVVKAAHGDSSGVRGAAWLWPERS